MDYDDAAVNGLIVEFYPINEYMDNIIDRINMNAIRDAGLKIALDPMYGVSEKKLPISTAVRYTLRMEAGSASDFPAQSRLA